MQGCATTKLTSVDPLAYKGQGRTKSIINEDVTVTVAVPTIAEKAPAEVTRPVDPHVNEARYDLAQDLAYSQALIKIGFIKGSGRRQSAAAEKASEDIHYTTDGLRVVLG
jgi:hypothetical protein